MDQLVQHVANNYVGPVKVQRLLFIAEHSPELRDAALLLALTELRASSNTVLYASVFERRFPDACAKLGLVPDGAWCDSVDKQAQQQLDRLEHALGAAKTSLVKEDVRLCHNELGDFYAERGDYSAALKAYVRARDYCTTARHSLSLCSNVVRVSVLAGNYTHVLQYVAKAEQTPEADDPVALARLQACAGLAMFEAGNFAGAARKLVECAAAAAADAAGFAELLLPRDLALCGGLCALASLDRAELKQRVIDAHPFRALLETVPLLSECAHAFHGAAYAKCLRALEALRPELLLEPHVRPHVDALCAAIRSRALINYFAPYNAIDLRRMAEAFGLALPALEAELVALITEGAIAARIDSATKVLHAQRADARLAAFRRAHKTGDVYAQECKAMLLRVNLLRADLVVKRASDTGGHHGGDGGGGSGGGGGGGGAYYGKRAVGAMGMM